MKKTISAAIIALSFLSFNAAADSCAKIVSYSVRTAVSEWGASVAEVKGPNSVSIFINTCETAIKAKLMGSYTKEEFVNAVKNGSSMSFEKAGMIDAADVNSMVASISFEYGTVN